MKASKQDIEALELHVHEAEQNYDIAEAAAQRALTVLNCLEIKLAKARTGKDVGDWVQTVGGCGKIDSVEMCKDHGTAYFKVFLTKKNGDPYKVTRAFYECEILPDEEKGLGEKD